MYEKLMQFIIKGYILIWHSIMDGLWRMVELL